MRSFGREQATGRRSSRRCRIARRHTRPPTIRLSTSTPSASRRNARTSASAATSATCAASASSRTRTSRRSSRKRSTSCEPGSPRPRQSPPPIQRSSSSTPMRIRRPPRRTTSPSSGGSCDRWLSCFLVEAVNDALHGEMERDASVIVMGEDVGKLGGVFRATAGLQERFGPDRCVDTPLAEAGIIGTAVGLCMAGWRPVCEMQYDAFSYPALDQLINHVGRYRWRTRGSDVVPAHDPDALRRRRPRAGAPRRLAGDVLRPHAGREGRDSVDARRRQGSARGGDPRPGPGRRARAQAPLPHDPKEEVPEGEHVVPLGEARIAREGTDLTIVAYGAMVPRRRASRRGARGGGVVRGARSAHR